VPSIFLMARLSFIRILCDPPFIRQPATPSHGVDLSWFFIFRLFVLPVSFPSCSAEFLAQLFFSLASTPLSRNPNLFSSWRLLLGLQHFSSCPRIKTGSQNFFPSVKGRADSCRADSLSYIFFTPPLWCFLVSSCSRNSSLFLVGGLCVKVFISFHRPGWASPRTPFYCDFPPGDRN